MYNPEIHHRHTIRLQEYNYSQNGIYFITICTRDRENIFGNLKIKPINDYYIELSVIGNIVNNEWEKLSDKFNFIKIHDYIVMPNHMHGIIEIEKSNRTLGNIIKEYKALTSKRCKSSIWQRNYYEHIIRNEKELYKIQNYIKQNPTKLGMDIENTNI